MSEPKRRTWSNPDTQWRADRFEAGKWPRGCQPYGFADMDLNPEPHEAAIVNLVFEHLDAGYNTTQIASGLNAHGVRTRRGFKWTRWNMRAIVDNRPCYLGTHIRDPKTGELVRSPVPRPSILVNA